MKKTIQLLSLLVLFAKSAHANQVCEGCTDAETTSVQLHQMLDTVKILKLIALEADELNPKTLKFYLSRYGSTAEVKALLESLTKETEVQAKITSSQQRKPSVSRNRISTTPKKLTKQPKGLEGLLVAHAQSENLEIGYRASTILSSNGRGVPLAIGNSFKHNGIEYVLESVTQYQNPDNSTGHSVSIKNKMSGEISSLPWKLGAK